MSNPFKLSYDGRTLTVRIPLKLKLRGGRKLIIAPENTPAWVMPARQRVDSAMIKALARAHRWKRLLESGEYASVIELAHAIKINESYLCRVLRVTLLAPDLVERLLDGRQPTSLQLGQLLKPLPASWVAQRISLSQP